MDFFFSQEKKKKKKRKKKSWKKRTGNNPMVSHKIHERKGKKHFGRNFVFSASQVINTGEKTI